MSKICPQCGNLNDDDKRFCTACGNPFVVPADQYGSSALPQIGPVAAAAQPDPSRLIRILAMAGISVIVIIIIILVLTQTGIAGILPSSKPPVTFPMVDTPQVTSGVVLETPSPEPMLVQTENLSLTTVSDTSSTSPTLTKAPVCPSDRRACGANCTDVKTDRANCGACGVSCSPSQVCQMGQCTMKCSVGETRCFDGCHNLLYDAQNCGICGNACPVGLTCNISVCAPTLPTTIPTYAG